MLCISLGADSTLGATLSFGAGVEKKRSDVIDLMKDLNVQLDNLCQVQTYDLTPLPCRWKVLSGFMRLGSLYKFKCCSKFLHILHESMS